MARGPSSVGSRPATSWGCTAPLQEAVLPTVLLDGGRLVVRMDAVPLAGAVPASLVPLESLVPPTSRRPVTHSTTILSVRHNGRVAIGGDGQVTYNSTVLKQDTRKIRKLLDGSILCGFAGSTADAFALLERFEAKVKDYPGNLPRAATELARDWRTDRALRRLEAMLIVVNPEHSLLITGQGDVVQPTDGILGIGSGGTYALAAARALIPHSQLSAAEIVRESLTIAAGIDVYTNTNLIVEELTCPS
jgi:ATP-dependent HslUV protease subunit HslV